MLVRADDGLSWHEIYIECSRKNVETSMIITLIKFIFESVLAPDSTEPSNYYLKVYFFSLFRDRSLIIFSTLAD